MKSNLSKAIQRNDNIENLASESQNLCENVRSMLDYRLFLTRHCRCCRPFATIGQRRACGVEPGAGTCAHRCSSVSEWRSSLRSLSGWSCGSFQVNVDVPARYRSRFALMFQFAHRDWLIYRFFGWSIYRFLLFIDLSIDYRIDWCWLNGWVHSLIGDTRVLSLPFVISLSYLNSWLSIGQWYCCLFSIGCRWAR